ncbi:MAG: hypothetical protein M0P73_14595 [Syntrophobacterales bacterium]|jgi:hypothetical protein|nr:hypothetical protein [Syntrophobacterales bacterium]
MSLISKIIRSLYKNDQKKMTNICLSFVNSLQEIIDKQGLTIKSNLFEIYFFVMCIVLRSYFSKRNKMVAECQVNLFIKELFNYIWVTYIEDNREIAIQMFDISNYLLLENMTMENLFDAFTKKLTQRIEFYSYSIILDSNDKSYKETVKGFIELTFGFKLNNSESELLRLFLSKEISNKIDITEKAI